MSHPIRALIVDDSASVRRTLTDILSADPDIEVIGAASDPYAAARRISQEVPDVITLDVEMPRMDGITFLKKLMAQHPVPVVMCSSLTAECSATLMQALEAGAVDVIPKPRVDTRQFLLESSVRICDVVKAAARANLKRLPSKAAPSPAPKPGTAANRKAEAASSTPPARNAILRRRRFERKGSDCPRQPAHLAAPPGEPVSCVRHRWSFGLAASPLRRRAVSFGCAVCGTQRNRDPHDGDGR